MTSRRRSSYRTWSQRTSAWTALLRQHLHQLPLRLRLVAIVVLLMLGALAVTSLATTTLLRHYLVSRTDSELEQVSQPLAAAALDALRAPSGRAHVNALLTSPYTIVIMPTNGSPPTLLVTSDREQSSPSIPHLGLNNAHVVSSEPFTVGSRNGSDTQWRVVAGKTSDDSATFAVAVPLSPVERTVDQLWLYTGLLALGLTIACAALGWVAVRRAFRPLSQIEDTAAAIAAGDLTRRIPPSHTHDEVASLATSLNVMLAQIEQSFSLREASEVRMRQFVADASHELRTPLATVRGYAELFRQGAVRDPEDVAGAMRRIEDEARRMGGLVEDLLLLTRLDSQRPGQFAPVDLTVLAGDAAQDARALAPDRRIRLLGLDGTLRPTVVEGDDARLRQVLTNLMANAINHTPAGSPIEIAIGIRPVYGPQPVPSEQRAVIEVRDHGHGVAAAEASKVFERFYRADPSRTRGRGGGTGLGLAIVAAIVGSHGGHVGLAPTPGGGATFVVDLPSANTQETSSDS
ncbi:MAG TPA: HAMP domain-containing sensor histidine kinase [Segeticoccus sp.]|uniref:sensor histidine kinase n=1 Tax=Segeticoccus sp. TaxID=2706531 RepID=UPI002D807434|nr:HAMP domain-containing sensor histidine kinase [Segeticoccus sp.]HET8600561.1 HAMP domain-containing sensor histidine kinase [Segeticoccus sp.]